MNLVDLETYHTLSNNFKKSLVDTQKAKLFFNNSPVGLFISDHYGTLIYADKTFTDITGIKESNDIIRRSWTNRIYDKDEKMIIQQLWEKSLKAEEHFEIQTRIKNHENKIIWVIIKTKPIEDGLVNGVLVQIPPKTLNFERRNGK